MRVIAIVAAILALTVPTSAQVVPNDGTVLNGINGPVVVAPGGTYYNTAPNASNGGIFGAIGKALRERQERRDTENALAGGLQSEGPPTHAQISALIANPSTWQLGQDLYLQRVGSAGFPFPSNQQIALIMANPATQAFGEAIYRKKMGLPPAR